MTGSSGLRELLDRAAEGPIGPPPIAELVGRGARRRRTWQATGVGLAAALTAAVILVIVGVANPATSSHSHGAHPIGPNPAGATAAQIADGTWQNVPVPPIKACGAQTVTASGDLVILVVSQGSARCPNAAAAYDPGSNSWTRLASPPVALRGQLTESRGVYVSRATGATATLNPGTGRWRSLATAPAAGPLAVLVTATTRPILIGVGSQHDETFALTGSHWMRLPALPHPGADIVALGAYSDGDTQWAFASEEHATHDGFTGGLIALRYDGRQWIKQLNLPNRPLAVQSVDSLDGRQLVIGDNCLPNASCPPAGLRLGLANLDQGQLEDIPQSPLNLALTAAVRAGTSVIGLDTDATVDSGGPSQPAIRPLASAIYDTKSRHWLPGPHGRQLNDISGMAWTSRGLVVLGDPTASCRCSLGGLILRPKGAHNPSRKPTATRGPAATRSVHPGYLPPGVRLAETRHLPAPPWASLPPGYQLPLIASYQLPGAVNRSDEHHGGDPTRLHPSTNLTVMYNPTVNSLRRALPPPDKSNERRVIDIAGNRAVVTVFEPDPRDIRIDWIDADGYHEVSCEGLTTAEGLSGLPASTVIRVARSLYPARTN